MKAITITTTLTALAALTMPQVVAEGDVLARIGDATVTRAEVLEAAGPELAELRQKEYEILKKNLDALVQTRLLEAAAKKAGLTLDEFLEQRVESKAATPTDAEVSDLYEKYKARMQGRTLEEARGQIVEYLANEKRRQIFGELMRELQSQSRVEVLLEAPRIQVAEGDNPTWGPANAPVTIIEFSDYECPFCSRAEATINQVKKAYEGKIRVVFRDFPLNFHQHAQKAHEAAGCAQEQGKFWEMHDKLFANQKALGIANLNTYATEIGLDMAKFETCLSSGARADEVKNDLKEGQLAGVSGTPAFFINGRFLSGAQPFDAFAAIIDEELARTTK